MGTHKSFWLSSRLMIGSIYPTHINNKNISFYKSKNDNHENSNNSMRTNMN